MCLLSFVCLLQLCSYMLLYKKDNSPSLCVGQMHLWNPDEPGTPRGSVAPLMLRLEEQLREACDELGMLWDGCASHTELLAVCEHVGVEVSLTEIQRDSCTLLVCSVFIHFYCFC